MSATIRTFALLAAGTVHLAVAQSYSVSTIAGTSTIRDGIPASQAFLRQPQAVQVDPDGNIYVLDRLDSRVRRIDPKGIITTVAGNGLAAFTGDGGPATGASLNAPSDIALDRQGMNLYIADTGNNRIRRVDLTTGIITTFAGNGLPNHAGDGGPAVKAGIHAKSVTVDASGNVYIGEATLDPFYNVDLSPFIRKVDGATGVISTFAGTGAVPGYSGDGGLAVKAQLNDPISITTDRQYLYIFDSRNSVIRRVDLSTNIITTFAGGGTSYCKGDCSLSPPVPLLQVSFNGLGYINMDAAGNLLIMDFGTLHYIAAGSSTISGIAGFYQFTQGYAGDGAGSLANIQFNAANGVAIAGPGDYLIADTGNRRLRRIKSGGIQTIAGFEAPDGQPSTSSILNHPTSAAMTTAGDLFIVDSSNYRIRKAAAGSGILSTVIALSPSLFNPFGVTVGPDNSIYATLPNPWGLYAGRPPAFCVPPFLLSAGCSFSQANGTASSKPLDRSPRGIRVDAQGLIYFTDAVTSDYVDTGRRFGMVRTIDPVSGNWSTIAGNTSPSSGVGENVPATSLGIVPQDVALDSAGNIYVADSGLWRIRKIAASTGLITTVAGGTKGNGGDGGPALKAGFLFPSGVTVDAGGNIFVADTVDMTIRRIDSRTGIITRVAGTGDNSNPRDTGAALATSIGATSVIALADGSLLVTDSINDRVRKLTLQTPRALSISSGDQQTGATGATVAVSARVTDAAGLPVAYVPVTFAVTSGTAQIVNATVSTVADGTATAQVALGASPGSVSVRATLSGVASATFTINVVAPFINLTNGVTGLPMSNPLVTALSQNGLMQISGQGFGAGGIIGDGDLVNGSLPMTFKSICVDLSGTRAPLLAVSPTQIIFQVPALQTGGTADVSVVTACGSGQDLQTAAVTLPVQATTPEFFYSMQNGQVTVMNNASGQPAPSSQPGGSVTVYLTGLGATDSTNPGDVVSVNAGVNANVTVQLGSQTITPDWVTTPSSFPGAPYIISIGENAGVYMIQFTIPMDAPPGNLPLVLTTDDGATSPANAYLTIAPAPSKTNQ